MDGRRLALVRVHNGRMIVADLLQPLQGQTLDGGSVKRLELQVDGGGGLFVCGL